jgi:beta-1,4-N-acetylglucosaminyltransferase
MIFVTVGTSEFPFDRLVRAIDVEDLSGEELVVQHGPSLVRPVGASRVAFLPYDELAETIRLARMVVTHAGVGSVMTALGNGKRPIVVPRLRRFGEAVDDHQLHLGRRLHEADLVTLVENPDDVLETLPSAAATSGVELGPNPRLVAELKEFVTRHTSIRRGHAA